MEETTLENELNAIDTRIETLKENIELGKYLEELHEDKRFQKIILNGYLDKEANRIFGVLVDPSHQLKRDVMENLVDKLSSIRNLKQYFGTVLINANMAIGQIEEEEEYRKEATKNFTIESKE